jgi:hypothetical protein
MSHPVIGKAVLPWTVRFGAILITCQATLGDPLTERLTVPNAAPRVAMIRPEMQS